jgi:hypothetical protein
VRVHVLHDFECICYTTSIDVVSTSVKAFELLHEINGAQCDSAFLALDAPCISHILNVLASRAFRKTELVPKLHAVCVSANNLTVLEILARGVKRIVENDLRPLHGYFPGTRPPAATLSKDVLSFTLLRSKFTHGSVRKECRRAGFRYSGILPHVAHHPATRPPSAPPAHPPQLRGCANAADPFGEEGALPSPRPPRCPVGVAPGGLPPLPPIDHMARRGIRDEPCRGRCDWFRTHRTPRRAPPSAWQVLRIGSVRRRGPSWMPLVTHSWNCLTEIGPIRR